MFFIISFLYFTPSCSFINCVLHRLADAICIHDNPAVLVTCSSAYSLNKRGLCTKKSLFVRIQNRNKSDFRNIQSFSKQVNADEHVEFTEAEIPNCLQSLKIIYFRMQISDFDSFISEKSRQVFCHPLGERRDEHSLSLIHSFIYLADYIINLTLNRSNLYYRVE